MKRTYSARSLKPLSKLVALALVTQLGCAPALPPAAIDPHQELHCRKIAVVARLVTPQVSIEGIPHSKSEGASALAGRTFKGCAEPLAYMGNAGGGGGGEAAVVFLAAVAAWLGVCGVASLVASVGGATLAPSAATMTATEEALSATHAVQQIQNSFRDRVIAAARSEGIEVVDTGPAGTLPEQGPYDLSPFRERGVDAILEVAISGVTVTGEGTSLKRTPVRLTLAAQSRALLVADGSELNLGDYLFHGESRTVDTWLANDRALLTAELETGLAYLTELIFYNVINPAALPAESP